MGREARSIMKRMADKLAMKWGKSYSEMMGWMRSRMLFTVLRATNHCVRGSRIKWRSGFGMEDGAGLAMVMH